MIVEQTSFFILSYFSKTELLELEWLEKTSTLTPKNFQEQVRLENEVLLKYKPKKLLAKTLDMDYTISPDEQEKHNEIILPTFKTIGLEKLAIVVSKDLFTQVSISQIIDDDSTDEYQTQYFDDTTSAITWLEE